MIGATRGTIEIGEDYDYVVTVHGPAGRETFSAEPPVPAWGSRPWHVIQDSVAAFQRHAAAVMRGAAEPMPSGAFTANTVALVDAAYASAAAGRRIDLVAVMRFNNFNVVTGGQSLGGHFEQFEGDVDANTHVGGHDDGDVFGNGFDFGFFGFRKTSGADHRLDPKRLAHLEMGQGAFGSGEVNQITRVLQALV